MSRRAGQFPAGVVVHLPEELRALADDEQVRARGRREGEADRGPSRSTCRTRPGRRGRRRPPARTRGNPPDRTSASSTGGIPPGRRPTPGRTGGTGRHRSACTPATSACRTRPCRRRWDLALQLEAAALVVGRDLQGGSGGLVELIAPAGGPAGSVSSRPGAETANDAAARSTQSGGGAAACAAVGGPASSAPTSATPIIAEAVIRPARRRPDWVPRTTWRLIRANPCRFDLSKQRASCHVRARCAVPAGRTGRASRRGPMTCATPACRPQRRGVE